MLRAILTSSSDRQWCGVFDSCGNNSKDSLLEFVVSGSLWACGLAERPSADKESRAIGVRPGILVWWLGITEGSPDAKVTDDLCKAHFLNGAPPIEDTEIPRQPRNITILAIGMTDCRYFGESQLDASLRFRQGNGASGVRPSHVALSDDSAGCQPVGAFQDRGAGLPL